ncbi:pseudouridine synthase [Fragilariopsis cylindrus CCMP1102]|uniref:Pseudouridine synthase n=1 Tax=Fragilariopsis cylindrus CCMP1102 TaxID=635003 RepID=A0A1E7FV26_9STRA|nr:pseudouridine synthase [Fragilariopsis cylindrus CCMP1102]|eukprot:OEU22006.1 pseudouridine synthase [Fragilariopsis cylindrus CCMP1102]
MILSPLSSLSSLSSVGGRFFTATTFRMGSVRGTTRMCSLVITNHNIRHISSATTATTTTTTTRTINTNTTTDGKRLIRLSKRMSELDMFSRREADRLIGDGRVFVDGTAAKLGEKISGDLQADRIEIIDNNNNNDSANINSTIITAVVLNKPVDYVSAQAEHGHPPAIRLLTSANRIIRGEEDDENELEQERKYENDHHKRWMGFAPAGRLDIDSTGLLVFTKNGVLAKKLIGSSSCVEKEYIVDVEKAIRVTKREYAMDPNFSLPSSERRFDLTHILRGGETLLGDIRPLKPCPHIKWIVRGKRLRITLTEGRKHQIRRMCRELLGWQVTGLQRVRIGPIKLPSSSLSTLSDENSTNEHNANKNKSKSKSNNWRNNMIPEGCWRPLRQQEIESLLANSNE